MSVENVDQQGQSTQPSEQASEPQGHWLGDAIKEHPSLERFKEPTSLAKSYVELERMASQRVPVPGENSSQEDWDKFYNRFRPKEYSEYHIELAGVDGLDEAKLANWKQTFYNHGLSQKQVEGIMKRFGTDLVEAERELNQQSMEQQTKAQVELKQEWGANYEANKGLVLAMLREAGGDSVVGRLGPYLESDPDVAKFLYDQAKMMRTSGAFKGEGSHNFGLMTVEEANKEKQAIMYDSQHPLYQSYHNNQTAEARKPAMNRILELNTIIAENQKRSGVA